MQQKTIKKNCKEEALCIIRSLIKKKKNQPSIIIYNAEFYKKSLDFKKHNIQNIKPIQKCVFVMTVFTMFLNISTMFSVKLQGLKIKLYYISTATVL